MSEHSTLTDGSVEDLIEEAIRICEIALVPMAPSPRQRELSLRATSLRRAFDRAQSLQHNGTQLASIRDLALELHTEVTRLVAKRASYRGLRIWPSEPGGEEPVASRRSPRDAPRAR